MKIVDDNEKDLPEDGMIAGNLVVRGPWVVYIIIFYILYKVAKGYYK